MQDANQPAIIFDWTVLEALGKGAERRSNEGDYTTGTPTGDHNYEQNIQSNSRITTKSMGSS